MLKCALKLQSQQLTGILTLSTTAPLNNLYRKNALVEEIDHTTLGLPFHSLR